MPAPAPTALDEASAAHLVACLRPAATAADVRQMLLAWKWISPSGASAWGDVREIDLLPNPGRELVVIYYPNLAEVIWNPQGKLIVLARNAARSEQGHWAVAFNADALDVAHARDGQRWRNWSYWLISDRAQDITGDGLDDLLLRVEYYNGHHTLFSHVVMLSGHAAISGAPPPLHLIFNVDNLAENARFEWRGSGANARLQAVRPAGHSGYLTRTFALQGEALGLASEQLDPPTAMVDLIQNLHRVPLTLSAPEYQVAYEWVAGALPNGDYPPHPNEQVLAEMLLIQLEQIALFNHANTDPNKDPDPHSASYSQYMQSATRRMWNDWFKQAQLVSPAGELFAGVDEAWRRSNNPAQVCVSIQAFIQAHPNWLAAMNRAARGLAVFNAQSACVATSAAPRP